MRTRAAGVAPTATSSNRALVVDDEDLVIEVLAAPFCREGGGAVATLALPSEDRTT